jgi:zinc protease
VVSGDVDAKEVFEKAAIIYGGIENEDAYARPEWPDVPTTYGEVTVTHKHESIQQPVWRKINRVPSLGQDYHEALALTIIGEILGGNTGELYEHMVVDNPIASDVAFYYSGINVDDTTISISATPLPDVDFTQVENGVNEVLNRVLTEGVEENELKNAVNKLIDESVYERDSLTGPAMMLGYQLAAGLNLEQAETWIYDLHKVTSEDIQKAIQKYLLPESDNYHAVTGYLMPKDEGQ